MSFRIKLRSWGERQVYFHFFANLWKPKDGLEESDAHKRAHRSCFFTSGVLGGFRTFSKSAADLRRAAAPRSPSARAAASPAPRAWLRAAPPAPYAPAAPASGLTEPLRRGASRGGKESWGGICRPQAPALGPLLSGLLPTSSGATPEGAEPDPGVS